MCEFLLVFDICVKILKIISFFIFSPLNKTNFYFFSPNFRLSRLVRMEPNLYEEFVFHRFNIKMPTQFNPLNF